jgi:hypothetical protein
MHMLSLCFRIICTTWIPLSQFCMRIARECSFNFTCLSIPLTCERFHQVGISDFVNALLHEHCTVRGTLMCIFTVLSDFSLPTQYKFPRPYVLVYMFVIPNHIFSHVYAYPSYNTTFLKLGSRYQPSLCSATSHLLLDNQTIFTQNYSKLLKLSYHHHYSSLPFTKVKPTSMNQKRNITCVYTSSWITTRARREYRLSTFGAQNQGNLIPGIYCFLLE